MFYWVAKNRKILRGQMRFEKNQSALFCCSVKEKCIFVDLFRIKDKFHCMPRVNYYTWGVHLRESVNKRKIQLFIPRSVRIPFRESVRLQECVNPECDWEVKWGFEKASVSRAVRLRECPLAES